MEHISSIIRSNQKSFFGYARAVLWAIFIVEVVTLIFFRETWVDEIFAPFKSYLVLKGEITPFVNSLFEYPPLYLITYGLVEYIFGPSIIAMRIFSASIFTFTVFLFERLATRLGGRESGIASLSLIIAQTLLIGNYIAATMYPFMFLGVTLLFWIEIGLSDRKIKTMYSAGIIALMILGRMNMVVVFIAYLLFMFVMRLPWKHYVLYIGIIGATVISGYIPLLSYNFPLAIAHILSPFGLIGPLRDLPPSLKTGGQELLRMFEILSQFFREYFGVLFFAVSASLLVLKERVGGILVFVRKESWFLLSLSMGLLLLLAHFFHPSIVGNVYYANYFIPIFILTGSVLWFRFLPYHYGAVVFVSVILLVVGTNLSPTNVISDPREESDIARVIRGAELLKKYTKPEDLVLSFDNSIFHVYLADRRTVPELINRDFHFLSDANTTKVKSIGFYNLEMLEDWIANDADFLLIHKERWPSSFLRLPFWGRGSEDIEGRLTSIMGLINEKYEFVDSSLNVYPRKYTDGNDGGTLLLYRRK